MKSSIFKSRKFTYGSMSLVFCIFFIAIVIVFNAIFSSLAMKYNWYTDMTGEKVFTLSDEAKEYIADVKSDVEIYFASDPDELMASSVMRYVYNTAIELQTDFRNISVECHDFIRDPAFFAGLNLPKGTTVTADTVIVKSGTETISSKGEAFFTVNEAGELWAYNGEYRFISNIMQVTQSDAPIVYFTTGHSEDVPTDEGSTSAAALTLAGLFHDYGFDVRPIDLSREDIADDARVIVIFNPKYDFLGIEADDETSNEIDKLDKFMDGLGGLLVFEDAEYCEGLTNLNEYLEEWGISFRSGTHIIDREHSMTVDGVSILAKYGSSDSFGASLYSKLRNFDGMPRSIIRKAMPVDVLWDSDSTMSGTRTVSPMLMSYDTSELIDNETGETAESGKEYPLLTVTLESRIIDNNHYYSYVMAAGSPSFASNNYLVSGAYGNSDVIFSAMKLIGRDSVLADLPFRPFDDTSSKATTAQSTTMTFELTFIIPVVIALVGTAVIIRRRHS